MTPGVDTEQVARWLAEYVAGLPGPGVLLTSETVERAEAARHHVLEAGPGAVPVLLDGFDRPSFAVKDACYDLLVEIGRAAIPALQAELERRPPVVRLWAIGALHALGDTTRVVVARDLLTHPEPYPRHLAALALAFQGLVGPADATAVVPVMIEALRSTARIEGTEFSIAGASLACLVAMTGEPFLPPGRSVVFYNYERFAFPPPVHPFPFPSDYLGGAPPDGRARIVAAVEAWWTRSRDHLRLNPIEPVWPIVVS